MTKPIKIYAEIIEPEALKQFESAMEQDFSVKGALMPDVHTGYSLPIGAVIATQDVIVPAWVGYDIGCGVGAVKTNLKKYIFTEEIKKKLFNQINRDIPMGVGGENKYIPTWVKPECTPVGEAIYNQKAKQLGSLGSGNHFIEIGYDSADMVWIIVHSGSRGVGHAIATHYMKLASGDGKAREGHYGFKTDSTNGKDYITDMNFALQFALENRALMLDQVEFLLNKVLLSQNKSLFNREIFINRNHNHAEYKNGLWIHRKGATHAEKGMYGVIPGNMKDGSFIVIGKGNSESLCSSSHGAGRVMSRTMAKKNLTMENFKQSMDGIVAKVDERTLDESPMAYKNIFEVMELQKDLVTVIEHIKPLINIKG